MIKLVDIRRKYRKFRIAKELGSPAPARYHRQETADEKVCTY